MALEQADQTLEHSMQNERMDWAVEEKAEALHWWWETVEAAQRDPEHRTLRQRMDCALEPLEEKQRLEQDFVAVGADHHRTRNTGSTATHGEHP